MIETHSIRTTGTPTYDRAVHFKRQTVVPPCGNGDDVAERGRHCALAISIQAPGEDDSTLIERKIVIAAGGDRDNIAYTRRNRGLAVEISPPRSHCSVSH